ncbi:hypothetical protein GOV05_03985 [Candidatus Woesearchaeota archaeon]|nr:hypothetical protein [Candidatus Woesearchaeota archaeon]
MAYKYSLDYWINEISDRRGVKLGVADKFLLRKELGKYPDLSADLMAMNRLTNQKLFEYGYIKFNPNDDPKILAWEKNFAEYLLNRERKKRVLKQ